MRVFTRENGERYAQDCECRLLNRNSRLLTRAKVPPRYEHCSLDSYESNFPGADRSLAAASIMARRFVDRYPTDTDGRGLLMTGSIGVGKTHLAVGILQALILEKGARGSFAITANC